MDANGDLGLPTIYWKASRAIIYYQVHLYYNAYTYIHIYAYIIEYIYIYTLMYINLLWFTMVYQMDSYFFGSKNPQENPRRHDRIMAVDGSTGNLQNALGDALQRYLAPGGCHRGMKLCGLLVNNKPPICIAGSYHLLKMVMTGR